MHTITNALPTDNSAVSELKVKLKKIAIDLAKKKIPEILTSVISKHLGPRAGEVVKDAMDGLVNEQSKKEKILDEIKEPTIYFNWLEVINEELKK